MKESKFRNSVTEEALIQYERYLKDGEKSRATVEKYLRDVRKFWDYLGEWGVQEFDKEQVLEYKRYLNEHYKTTSANSMLAAINSFFEYLGCEEYKVKLFKIQRVQFCEPEKELTEKEYGRLVQAAERKGDSRMSML
ncbi:site-specific integrase, partial [Hungatella hathewayi]